MPGTIGVGSQVSEATEPMLEPRCTATHEADGGRQQGQGRAGQDQTPATYAYLWPRGCLGSVT